MSQSPALPRVPATAWAPLLREALAREGSFHWRLRGASMWPTLPRECEIEVARLPERLGLGALVVFVAGDSLIAHRLVHRVDERWVTQGDGCLAPDLPLAPEQVLGVVTAAYREGRRCWPGRVSRWLTWFWIVRYHALKPVRFVWRRLRKRRAASS